MPVLIHIKDKPGDKEKICSLMEQAAREGIDSPAVEECIALLNTSSCIKQAFMQLCRILPLRPFFEICKRSGDVKTRKVHTFLGGGSKYGRSVFDRKYFEESVEMIFEDGEFPVSACADEMLTVMYGNYMRIPDVSERNCKEHVEILDLDTDYTHYLETQKTMKIHGVSKSIR